MREEKKMYFVEDKQLASHIEVERIFARRRSRVNENSSIITRRSLE